MPSRAADDSAAAIQHIICKTVNKNILAKQKSPKIIKIRPARDKVPFLQKRIEIIYLPTNSQFKNEESSITDVELLPLFAGSWTVM